MNMKLFTNKNIIQSILLLAVLIFSSCNSGSKKPEKADILKAMNTANNYYMNKFPDPGVDLAEPDGTLWKSNVWTFGTYASGLMDFYNINKDPRLLIYITDWAEKHQWKINPVEMWNDHLAGLAVSLDDDSIVHRPWPYCAV